MWRQPKWTSWWPIWKNSKRALSDLLASRLENLPYYLPPDELRTHQYTILPHMTWSPFLLAASNWHSSLAVVLLAVCISNLIVYFWKVCTLFSVIGLIICLWSLGFKMRGRKIFGNVKLGILSSLGASYYPAVDITPTTLPIFTRPNFFLEWHTWF